MLLKLIPWRQKKDPLLKNKPERQFDRQYTMIRRRSSNVWKASLLLLMGGADQINPIVVVVVVVILRSNHHEYRYDPQIPHDPLILVSRMKCVVLQNTHPILLFAFAVFVDNTAVPCWHLQWVETAAGDCNCRC